MNRTPAPSTDSPDHWHRHWFDQDYLALYRHRDHREADRFLDMLTLQHGFSPLQPDGRPTRVLDLGCGSGRHSLELARRGFDAVGLDWSADLLAVAHAQDPVGRFVRADMAHPPLRPVFHWVLSLFTSFGYRGDDGDNRDQLVRMAGLCLPEGRLLIDFLNPVQVRAHLVPHSVRHVEGRPVQETRHIDEGTNQVIKELEFTTAAGESRRVHEAVKLYPPDWFLGILEPLGFGCLAHLGDYDGSPWTAHAGRSILLLGRNTKGTP